LECWQDGTLTDPGANASGKIDCSKCIFILTANWGQREINHFFEKNKERMQKKIEGKDNPWIQKELVKKILRPLCMKEFGSVDESIKALCRRIDDIVPFLPFTKRERRVVADIAVSHRFSLYREPCVLRGPEDKRRYIGNLHLRSTKSFAAYAADSYDPMQGASGMLAAVHRADGRFQMMVSRDKLGLSDEQRNVSGASLLQVKAVPTSHTFGFTLTATKTIYAFCAPVQLMMTVAWTPIEKI
jgi:hypothetical protein